MTVTIRLGPEAGEKLRKQAAETGLTPDAPARPLLEQALNAVGQGGPSGRSGAALDEILAPLRKEAEESGMSDEDLKDFFNEVPDEVRAGKRARG